MANTKIKKEKVERRGSIANECRDIKIFNLCQEGYSRDQLAEMYSLKPQTISHILGNIDYNLKHGFYSNYSEHPEYIPLVFESKYSKSYRGLVWDNIPYQLYILLDYRLTDAKGKEKDKLIKEDIVKIAKERVVKSESIKNLYDFIKTLYDLLRNRETEKVNHSERYPWGKEENNGQ